MSPEDARRRLLCAEIERDWGQVEVHLGRSLLEDPLSGDAAAALVALSLDHAYQAFETILLRVERALGLPTRSGGGECFIHGAFARSSGLRLQEGV